MSLAFSNLVGTRHVLAAPAKLNLRLKLLGRRPDGYHLLSMLNTKISLADELELLLNDTGKMELTVSYPHSIEEEMILSDPGDNIATRAFRMVMEQFKLPLGVRLHITKNIPVGAGLGGGSSDGAAVLLLLAQTLKAHVGDIPSPVLKDLALRLGADVPFFLSDNFSHVGGTGEEVRGLGSLRDCMPPMLLIVPPIKIPTAEIYAQCRAMYPSLERGEDPAASHFMQNSGAGKERGVRLLSLVENDLERVAVKLYPELGEFLSELRRISGITCAMTGSGSGIFCIGEKAVLAAIPPALSGRGMFVREIYAL